MGIFDIFYTEQVSLLIAINSNPNVYGIIEQTKEVIKANIPSSVVSISAQHSLNKYGINSKVSFEATMDYFDECEKADFLEFEGVTYKIETFTIHPTFMVLTKSITFGMSKL